MNEEILRAMYKARLLEQDPASYEYRWNADGVRKLERGLEREIQRIAERVRRRPGFNLTRDFRPQTEFRRSGRPGDGNRR
jgi:hypothetical protein